MKRMLFIPYAEHSAGFNMGLDSALLAQPPKLPLLRVYGWQPATLTLGRFQEVDHTWIRALQSAGISVTRRVTGGGAILHAGELTYSIVATTKALGVSRKPESAYRVLHGAWMDALSRVCGVARESMQLFERVQAGSQGEARTLCFTRRTAFDVVIERVDSAGESVLLQPRAHELFLPHLADPADSHWSKLIGSAQRRKGDVLLQHGSIKLARSPFAPWVGCVSELAGLEITAKTQGDLLASAFADALGFALEAWELDDALLDSAEREAQARFEREDWVLR